MPGINEAVCGTGADWERADSRHLAPAHGCACGITALARFAEADAHWRPETDIRGAVEAWGDEDEDGNARFYLHGTGFRAQFAKIILLAIDEDWPTAKRGAIRALAQEHGADTCRREHLEDAAKEHGQLVPDELLEWAGEGHVPAIDFPSWNALYPTAAPPTKTKARRRPRGIKAHSKTAGPPPLGKWRKGDRIIDRKNVTWRCVKGGEPGSWTEEE